MLVYLNLIEDGEDKSKLEQLYLRYRQLMFAVAIKVLGHSQDAEDAVQQAFLSVLQNLEKISQVDCPKTRAFLVIITERKAIDILRARGKGGVELDENLLGLEIPPPGDSPLADAMARLPARDREALLLRYYSGYSAKETAQILGISQSAGEKLLWRAKQRLKALMEEGQPV